MALYEEYKKSTRTSLVAEMLLQFCEMNASHYRVLGMDVEAKVFEQGCDWVRTNLMNQPKKHPEIREMHPADAAELSHLTERQYEWASIINRLAHIALDGGDSNDRDYAQDVMDMVRPFLPGATTKEAGYEQDR